MDITPRRVLSITDDRHWDAGTTSAPPLRKVAVIAVLENPFAGRHGADLSAMIAASEALGRRMGEILVRALDGMAVQSYGKGGIVGLAGEQEHANALLTTRFANPLRDAIGGGDAWISSFTKVAPPGEAIDIPLNNIHDVYVRSHYDGMTVALPGGPLSDEIAIIFCAATGGRINARVGGMTHESAVAAARRG
jgi:hypothetical protein